MNIHDMQEYSFYTRVQSVVYVLYFWVLFSAKAQKFTKFHMKSNEMQVEDV